MPKAPNTMSNALYKMTELEHVMKNLFSLKHNARKTLSTGNYTSTAYD